MIVLVSSKKNILFVDQAVGKHEFITYAVGISENKKVQGIEIMEYRETYGSDVRKVEWRKQFVGKDASAPLKLGKDITNISGATLSSAHITAGVRRLLQTAMKSSGTIFRRCRPLLGTFVEVCVSGAAEATLRNATEGAFQAIEEVGRAMSFHDSGSELSRLNHLPWESGGGSALHCQRF